MPESFFFNTLRQLRGAIDAQEEPRSVLNRFNNAIADPDIRFHFLNTLTSPAWIEPLAEAGFFNAQSGFSNEQSELLFEAALLYLARIAPTAPRQAAYWTASIPAVTARRISIAVEIAMALPGRQSAMVADHIIVAILIGMKIVRTDMVSSLIQKLCHENESLHALTLFRVACEMSSTDGEAHPSWMDDYHLLQMLDKCVPDLVKATPLPTIKAVIGILRTAVSAKRHNNDDPLRDFSYMWRPAIEEHPQNRTFDLAGSLVTPVRNAIESSIQSGAIPLPTAMELLDKQSFLIFKRLRLYVINTFADQSPEIARENLLNQELFDDYRFKHEYARFIDNRFDLLGADGQQTFLSWIEAGPDLAKFREFAVSNVGRGPNDQEEKRRIEYWKYEKLWWIRRHLTGHLAVAFTEMEKKYGEPQMADLNVRTSGGFGRESPVAAEDLKGKDVDSIVQLLKDWVPAAIEISRASRAGLGDALHIAITGEPGMFAANAMLFRDLHPIYIRTVINALCTAVEQSKAIELSPPLELCKWVVEQNIAPGPTTDVVGAESGREGDWQTVRDAVDRFAEALCKKKVSQEYRQRIWQIMPSLRSDPHRSGVVETEVPQDERRRDYTTQSLNTPRARALHAVIEYAWWVHESTKNAGNEGVDLNAMPEVQAVLDGILENGNDQSPAVYAAFGWWFIRLYLIDKSWMKKNVGRIFKLDTAPGEPLFGWAAWNTYLLTQSVYDDTFELLRLQYQKTVEVLPDLVGDQDQRDRPLGSLAVHLMVMYARSILELDDANGIIQGFFAGASTKLRSHAMFSIGQSLQNSGDIGQPIRDRLMKLWDWYWANWGSSQDASSLSGYEFGTWFVSGAFDNKWALTQLSKFSEVTPLVEPDSSIMEKVAETADADLVDAIAFTDRYVRGDIQHWRVFGAKESLKKILPKALASDLQQVKEIAVNLVDYLGRKGYLEFGTLLESATG